jgi:NitT/TauT family transport system substrate-binding protein
LRILRIFAAISWIIVLLIPAACFAQAVRIGTWKTAQTIQPFFYDQFLPQTMPARVYPFTNPADQKAALLAGSLDMCGTTLAHAIHAASQGQPVVLVASLCNKCSALVVKKKSPVRHIADLKAKKIGYVPGTMHEILLREALTRNGLVPDRDVVLVRVDFFDMGLALARGSIDAFLSGEPFPTLAESQGYGRILEYPYYGEAIGTINAGMLAKRGTLDENPALISELVLAHARTTIYLKANVDKWLQKAATFGTPLPILKQASANMELAWQMDEDFARKTRALGERMQALGVIDRQPDYDRLLDLFFVRQAQKRISKEFGSKDKGFAQTP